MTGEDRHKEPGRQRPGLGSIPMTELYPELEAILKRSELLAARPSNSDKQVDEMARHLASIRALLADLLTVTNADERGEQGAVLKQLVGRFLKIEGKVKEIRNDRMVAIMREAEPKRRDSH